MMQPRDNKKSELLQLVSGVDLFSALNDDQLSIIADIAIPKKCPKGELIFQQGDVSDQSLFIIASGQVQVFLTSQEGRETILALLNEGDFFGEMSLLDKEPRSASVQASQASQLLVIRRQHFLQTLQKFPELMMSLFEEMSKRLRKANNHVSSLITMSVYGRLATILLELEEERGIRTRCGENVWITVIPNRPSQQQLADMAGTSRETVSRVLNHFQKEGAISLEGKNLIIVQQEILKNQST